MMIKELTVRNNQTAGLAVSWKLSDGEQTAYDLFLIQKGSVIERVRAETGVMGCALRTTAESTAEYSLLLTVRSGQLLATARSGFYPHNRFCQQISFG